jgi:hypothetical protein
MTDKELEDTGAIDWILVEFKDKELNGELVPPLLDLVNRRLVRILDAMIVVKRTGDDYDVLTADDLDPAQVGDLGELAGASSGLFDAGDAADAAAAIGDNSAALAIIYENLWSLEFATAVRKAGGELINTGHIPTQSIVARLDELGA